MHNRSSRARIPEKNNLKAKGQRHGQDSTSQIRRQGCYVTAILHLACAVAADRALAEDATNTPAEGCVGRQQVPHVPVPVILNLARNSTVTIVMWWRSLRISETDRQGRN